MDTTLIIMLSAGAGVTALLAAVFYIVNDLGTTKAEDRLAVMTGQKVDTSSQGVLKKEMIQEGVAGIGGLLNSVLKRFHNLKMLFEQADSPIRVDQFMIVCGLSAIIMTAIALIGRSPKALLPIVFMMGFGLPWGWLLFRRSRRFKRFECQLPDAMELIGRALRSGHSLASGLSVVVDEMPNPISQEFHRAYEEQNLGIPIERALKNMLTRIPNMDLKFFVTAVAIQRQSGGDLAEILDKISHIIRERFKILGQVKALTGEGRISGIVLMALPVALFFAVYYLNPEYIMLLFTEPLGRKMIYVAAFLQVLGAIVIKKIVAIKV
jgi:tight adherence protein B